MEPWSPYFPTFLPIAMQHCLAVHFDWLKIRKAIIYTYVYSALDPPLTWSGLFEVITVGHYSAKSSKAKCKLVCRNMGKLRVIQKYTQKILCFQQWSLHLLITTLVWAVCLFFFLKLHIWAPFRICSVADMWCVC